MPSGKPVDWSLYDQLIIDNLPDMTIVDWCQEYAPSISAKTISSRARLLNVKPKKYIPTPDHKHKIANTLSAITPEIVERIKSMRQLQSKRSIAKALDLSLSTVNRIIEDHNIILTEDGIKRWREASRQWHLGKIPWNKGKSLSEEHKVKMAIGRQKMSGRLSKLQLSFYKILDELDIFYYKEHDPKCRFGHWLFDGRIVHDNYDFLVEVQGDYIHSLPKNKAKDLAKATYMERYFPHIPIKYIWEHEFGAVNKVKQKVLQWVGQSVHKQIDFDFSDVTISPIDDQVASAFLSAFHYIGKLSARFRFGAYLGEKLIAVAVYGAPTRVETAERLGCATHNCLELRRFVIHDSYHKYNFGSYLMSKFEKLLPKQYHTLVSFVDESMGFSGTLYKASNWLYDGKTESSYFYIDDEGYVMLKKTLYNLACKMHMKEADYAHTYGYTKVPLPYKQRYIKRR